MLRVRDEGEGVKDRRGENGDESAKHERESECRNENQSDREENLQEEENVQVKVWWDTYSPGQLTSFSWLMILIDN